MKNSTMGFLQYEGAAAEDGRKPSIFDNFTHTKGMFQHAHFICIVSSSLLYFGILRPRQDVSCCLFFNCMPGATVDGGNGDVAVDQYHRYKVLQLCKSQNNRCHMHKFPYTLATCKFVIHSESLGAYRIPVLFFLNLDQ